MMQFGCKLCGSTFNKKTINKACKYALLIQDIKINKNNGIYCPWIGDKPSNPVKVTSTMLKNNLFHDLPDELQMEIRSYGPEHRDNMKPVLKEIEYVQNCDTCGKRIIGNVWSSRGGYEECCSAECVDNYGYQYAY